MRVTTWEWIHTVAVRYRGDDCLQWPFARGLSGRGAAWRPGVGWCAAHVEVCKVVHGPAPSLNHEVAHSCGRGHEGCVSPKHLRWATPAENSADAKVHGTLYQGARHHKAKLSKADAQYVLVSDLKGVDLARYFDVSPAAICYIRRGRNWKSAAL